MLARRPALVPERLFRNWLLLAVAILFGIVVGTWARGPAAGAWIFVLLLLSALSVAIAQQTLP